METEKHGKKYFQKLSLSVCAGRMEFRENRDGFVSAHAAWMTFFVGWMWESELLLASVTVLAGSLGSEQAATHQGGHHSYISPAQAHKHRFQARPRHTPGGVELRVNQPTKSSARAVTLFWWLNSIEFLVPSPGAVMSIN